MEGIFEAPRQKQSAEEPPKAGRESAEDDLHIQTKNCRNLEEPQSSEENLRSWNRDSTLEVDRKAQEEPQISEGRTSDEKEPQHNETNKKKQHSQDDFKERMRIAEYRRGNQSSGRTPNIMNDPHKTHKTFQAPGEPE